MPISCLSKQVHRHHGDARGGFTLLELLVIIAIIAIIAAISVPTIGSILNSYNLSSSGQAVLGQLSFARQSALSSNKAVEVRFYQTGDSNMSSASLVYRSIQAFREDTNSSGNTIFTPLGKPYFLPASFAFSSNSTASSLLASGNGIASSVGDPTNPLPPPYGTSSYLYFRFRPSGATDLTASMASLTIYQRTAKIVANNLPANFLTVEVDSVNGNERIYQP